VSAPNLANLLSVPGQLCKAPTDLTAAYPHGGTALGAVKEIVAMPFYTTYRRYNQVFGTTVQTYKTGEAWVLSALLREADSDTLSLIFGSRTANTKTVYEQDLWNDLPGQAIADISLLFSPLDLERHPFVWLPRACPELDAQAELMHGRSPKRLEYPVVFVATPDSSGVCYRWGYRGSMDLT